MAYMNTLNTQCRTELELYEEIKSQENESGPTTQTKDDFKNDETITAKTNRRSDWLIKALIAFFIGLVVIGATIGMEQLIGHNLGSGVSGLCTWSSWSSCSTTCGIGTKTRQFNCSELESKYQYGPVNDVELCNEKPCYVSGLCTWSSWSSCSTTCGIGTKTRQFNCSELESKYQYGPVNDVELCNEKPCYDQCNCTHNLALNKPCGQSSLYQNDSRFSCHIANDGEFSKFMHTNGETFPFWWVDLQTTKSVRKVIIHNRYDKNYIRLQNINVTVGDNLSSLHQCGYHDGPVQNKEPLSIKCSQAVTGRYVQIMLMRKLNEMNILHLTEIEVYDCMN